MNPGNRKIVTAGLMIGLLVAAIDQTIVDTAFPRMISDLHGESIFTWVLTIYMLASTAIVPVVGKLADIYGRKIFYLSGLIVFVGGSMLCGIATSMGQLIAFRALQGLGAGMLMPITFTIVGDLFPGEERAKMQGLFSGVWGLASIIGPKLGGWITHNYSWRYIFYINLPIGLIAMAMMFLYYQESKGQRRPIDWLGAFTVTSGIVMFLLGVAQGGEAWAWVSWQSALFFGGATALIISFVYIQTRVEEPILDLKLFQNRIFLVMIISGLLLGAGMFGAIVFVPWFVQGVVGANPDQAGNVMTPMMLSVVLFSIVSGRLALWISYRIQMTIGFVLIGIGFVLMTRWSVDTTQLRATLDSMVVGAGLGMIMPLLTVAVQNSFPASRRGVVTSTATFFRQIGATVGITFFGVLFNAQMAKQFETRLASRFQAALGEVSGPIHQFLLDSIDKPQGLVRLLLTEDARTALPPMLTTLPDTVKLMMTESLHTVFWSGLVVVCCGVVVVQFLGNTNLRKQVAQQGVEAQMAPASSD